MFAENKWVPLVATGVVVAFPLSFTIIPSNTFASDEFGAK